MRSRVFAPNLTPFASARLHMPTPLATHATHVIARNTLEQVGMGPLCDIASFGTYYVGSAEHNVCITDFHNRCWKRVGRRVVNGALETGILVRPRLDAVMSSAILAAPGASTGELLIGYPFTSVSTSSRCARAHPLLSLPAPAKAPPASIAPPHYRDVRSMCWCWCWCVVAVKSSRSNSACTSAPS
jgi:hypothetical protein